MNEPELESAVRAALADRYAIERELGRGGMATVYLAYDVRLGRRVAIKVMLPEVSATLGTERFLREVRVAAQLNHPNILALHDSGRVGVSGNGTELLYYVMPFVEGESLRERLRREGPLPVTDALRIASEVAGALSFAHTRGIVHRDIKPENILLARPSAESRIIGHPLVADFGIARIVADGSEALTSTGMSVGTPAYMSPEQAAGERSVDARSDIYSLGCVLYEMLVGEPPYTGPTAAAIVARHLSAPVPSIRLVRPSVPAELEALVQRALEKVPADRVADAGEFKASLDRVGVNPSGDSNAGRAGNAADSPAVRTQRSRRSIVAVAAVTIALGGYLAAARAGLLGSAAASLPPAPDVRVLDAHRIAVVPLRMTGDTSEAYLADAFTDDLISALARIGSLRVISRSSAASVAAGGKAPGDIGRVLNVGSVVEGTFRKRGDSILFNVRLIDTNDGAQKWTHQYVHRVHELAGVQDSAARAIAQLVGGGADEGAGGPTRRLTPVNGPAYDAYLRGVFVARRASVLAAAPAVEDTAVKLFEQAIRLDSAFALPHAAIAAIYQSRSFNYDPQPEWEQRAFVEIEKALAIDPNLAEAYQQKGNLTWTKSQGFPHEAAAKLHHKAAALKPSLVDPHSSLGSLYMHVGLFDRALAEYDTALTLDPTTTFVPPRVARVHWYQKQYERALHEFEAFADRAAGGFVAEHALVLDYLGKRDAALAMLDSAGGIGVNARSGDVDAVRAVIFAEQGKRAEALAAIVRAERDGAGASHFHHAEYSIAAAYALLGDHGKAIDYLRRTSADGMPCYPLFRDDPHLRGLANDPAFVQFMAEAKQRWERLAKALE